MAEVYGEEAQRALEEEPEIDGLAVTFQDMPGKEFRVGRHCNHLSRLRDQIPVARVIAIDKQFYMKGVKFEAIWVDLEANAAHIHWISP